MHQTNIKLLEAIWASRINEFRNIKKYLLIKCLWILHFVYQSSLKFDLPVLRRRVILGGQFSGENNASYEKGYTVNTFYAHEFDMQLL